MGKNKKRTKGIMYSTNPNYEYEYEDNTILTIPKNQQKLKIYIEKYKAGKIAVIIRNFIGSTDDLKNLSKILKSQCGVGGIAKNNEIIIQGNIREQVISILKKEGYNYIKVGG